MNVLFKIIKLTKEFVETTLLDPVPIHRHDHEELIIVTHGKPFHLLDYTKIELQSPVIVYVAQGKIHNFTSNADTRGGLFVIKMSYFLIAIFISIPIFLTRLTTL